MRSNRITENVDAASPFYSGLGSFFLGSPLRAADSWAGLRLIILPVHVMAVMRLGDFVTCTLEAREKIS
jgi:hypothetical protein